MNTQDSATRPLRPSAAARRAEAYVPAPDDPRIDLRLDANEGPGMSNASVRALWGSLSPELLRRYPRSDTLEARIGGALGVERRRVLVTAGADEAIERLLRATIEPGRGLICTSPTFEIIPNAARACGGFITEVPWLDAEAPIEAMLDLLDEDTGAVAIVSPNNPTGLVATEGDLLRLAGACKRTGAALLVDLAYVEFADRDPTPALLAQPNVVITRTFSKAWGLAGLRVGYAAGDERLVEWARGLGGPFPVSGVSLAMAQACLDAEDDPIGRTVEVVRSERRRLADQLRARGVGVPDSQANFILAQLGSGAASERVWRGLRDRGIAVRRFQGRAGLESALRISCPADESDFARLSAALGECLSVLEGER